MSSRNTGGPSDAEIALGMERERLSRSEGRPRCEDCSDFTSDDLCRTCAACQGAPWPTAVARGAIAGRPVVVVVRAGDADLSELRAEGAVVLETTTPELLLRHLRSALRLEPYKPSSWSPRRER